MTGSSLEIGDNPYSAPNDGNNESVGSFFPWRLIPAAIIGLLGVLSFGIGTHFADFLVHWVLPEGVTSGVQESVVAIGFCIGPGLAWIASTVLLWKNRYALAILLIVSGLAIPLTLQP